MNIQNNYKNSLSRSKYLISEILANAFISGKIHEKDSKVDKGDLDVYLVGVRILNKSSNIVVINYIYIIIFYF